MHKFLFSLINSTCYSCHCAGTTISVCILSSLLKIDDALIGVMSNVSKLLSSFVYAFAQFEWQIYIASVVEIISGTSFIAMRSIASKTVSSNELGKIHSVLGIVESIAPLIYSPIMTAIYSATITTMPGAFLLFSGLMMIPGSILFM